MAQSPAFSTQSFMLQCFMLKYQDQFSRKIDGNEENQFLTTVNGMRHTHFVIYLTGVQRQIAWKKWKNWKKPKAWKAQIFSRLRIKLFGWCSSEMWTNEKWRSNAMCATDSFYSFCCPFLLSLPLVLLFLFTSHIYRLWSP